MHRDIKPENVLISAKGEVKIADFGLVRAVTSQTMATGDVILGTVAYLSPEQVATGAADTRSDVYAAGIVAWEMLTGRPPYTGDNAMSVAYQHVHSDVPPVSVGAPGVPEALEDLILAATRRDPLARPRDAAAFLSAVVGVRARLGLRRVPVPVPHRDPTGAGPRRPAVPDGRPMVGAAERHRPAAGQARRTGVGGGDALAATTVRPAGTRGRTFDGRPAGRPERHEGGAGDTSGHPAAGAAGGAAVGSAGWCCSWCCCCSLPPQRSAAGGWAAAGSPTRLTLVGLSRTAAENRSGPPAWCRRCSEASDNAARAGTVARRRPGARHQAAARLARSAGGVDRSADGARASGRAAPPHRPPRSCAAHQLRVAATAIDGLPRHRSGRRRGVRTEPAAGQRRVRSAQRSQLVLSKGPAPVRVPFVAGKTVEDARNKLLVDGFTVAGTRSSVRCRSPTLAS